MNLHSIGIDPPSSSYYDWAKEPGLEMKFYYRCRIDDNKGLSSWSTNDWVNMHQLGVL